MDKVLQMNFRTGLGRNMRITLEDPREDLTADDIKDVMNLIISKDIFNVEGGLAQIASASIVTTQTQQVVFE
ncbi:MAG: DUF2922 domain-containing protein [Caldicoprobacterales bacterium]|nr:DUF2922 domain-containing protein [Clostridiales bacterium]